MFNFIKKHLQKIYSSVSSALASFLQEKKVVDQNTLNELERILLSADTGIKTTRRILTQLEAEYKKDPSAPVKQLLESVLISILDQPADACLSAQVHILVGVNGCGKTTFAAKLAHHYAQQGKAVLLVAADTFRAAAPEQLTQWATAVGATLERGTPGQDPSSVVFNGCERFKKEHFDHLIIDTAGRLQNKSNLMQELAKIKRVITKQLGEQPVETLLTVDSMLGQNSLEQAHVFKEITDVSSVVLTKMDGTAKGGIVFSIAHELHIPISYVSYGEKADQFKSFEKRTYVHELLNL